MSDWVNARLLVIAAAGASAGVHAALAPAHLEEARTTGVLFVLAAVGLAGLSAALALWPDRAAPAAASALMFAALVVAYVVLRDDPFDAIAAGSKAVEAIGFAGAIWLLWKRPVGRPGDLALAYFGFTFILAFVIAAGGHAHGH